MKTLGLFAALLAVQPAPVEFRAKGPWEVATLDVGCQVTRLYTGDAEVELGFETHLTGSATIMLVAAPKTMLPDGQGSIRVATGAGQALDLHYGAFAAPDPNGRVLKIFQDGAGLASIAAAETLEIGATPIRLPVKGVGGALKALNDCTAGLLASWGADPQRWRDGKLAGFAGQPQSWLTDDDADRLLPRGVARGGITALLTTTASGAPASCKAVTTTDPRLNTPFCELLMKRVKFRAPLGDDGKPLESYIVVPFKLTR